MAGGITKKQGKFVAEGPISKAGFIVSAALLAASAYGLLSITNEFDNRPTQNANAIHQKTRPASKTAVQFAQPKGP